MSDNYNYEVNYVHDLQAKYACDLYHYNSEAIYINQQTLAPLHAITTIATGYHTPPTYSPFFHSQSVFETT